MKAGSKVPLGRPELLALGESMEMLLKTIQLRLGSVKGRFTVIRRLSCTHQAVSYVQTAESRREGGTA